MSSLTTSLPQPSRKVYDREDFQKNLQLATSSQVVATISKSNAPPYGKRIGWIPRGPSDYGDGGAFPEIPVAQYPLGMGQQKASANSLAVQLDSSGKIKYDAIARQGKGKDEIVYSKLKDLLPKSMDEMGDLEKPSEEEIEETTDKTRNALERLVNSKISAAMPVKCAEKQAPAQYIRYTPTQQGVAFNSGAKQRIIRMVEAQKDPMEPPRFEINKKIPKGPPSPQAPILHSPTRKVTPKEQADWKIPPCISNWKNSKGFTIPLDKRLAADGRGLQSTQVNENFDKLAQALNLADKRAREAVELRAQQEKKISQKLKEKKEEELRVLAQKALKQKIGIQDSAGGKDSEANEREAFRRDREKERQRERNIARAGGGASKAERDKDRDITEAIALGKPNPEANKQFDTQFDARLFNTSKGLDSGFGGEDSYTVYDKAWRAEKDFAGTLYRPTKTVDSELYGDVDQDIVKGSKSRFEPDRPFEGADKNRSRTGPVAFEKDPFQLSEFLQNVKTGQKRTTDDNDGSSSKKRK